MTTATQERPQEEPLLDSPPPSRATGGKNPNKGRRYPRSVHDLARKMGERGYGIQEVRFVLARRGHFPSERTIAGWMDPDYAEAHLLSKRKGGMRGPTRSRSAWRMRRERIDQLREAGLSFSAVAKVLGLDFGITLSSDQVRHIAAGRVPEANVKRMLMGESVSRGRVNP